jgi:hypothetical protein
LFFPTTPFPIPHFPEKKNPMARLGLRADNAWIGADNGPQKERADVDDAATRVACVTTGSGDCA